MSELKQEIEKLDKKFYLVQDKLKTAKQTVKEIGDELKNEYKLDVKLINDPAKLRQYVDKHQESIKLANEKLLAEVRALNDRITIA